MTTVYVALVDRDYNNYSITGVFADLEHAKVTVAAEYERPGRTLEWREQRGEWDLYALGEGYVHESHIVGRGTVKQGDPDRWLDVTIEAHELHQATTEEAA